jgi:hypothetical protein
LAINWLSDRKPNKLAFLLFFSCNSGIINVQKSALMIRLCFLANQKLERKETYCPKSSSTESIATRSWSEPSSDPL